MIYRPSIFPRAHFPDTDTRTEPYLTAETWEGFDLLFVIEFFERDARIPIREKASHDFHGFPKRPAFSERAEHVFYLSREFFLFDIAAAHDQYAGKFFLRNDHVVVALVVFGVRIMRRLMLFDQFAFQKKGFQYRIGTLIPD